MKHLGLLTVVSFALAAGVAHGQVRVQFPSAVTGPSAGAATVGPPAGVAPMAPAAPLTTNPYPSAPLNPYPGPAAPYGVAPGVSSGTTFAPGPAPLSSPPFNPAPNSVYGPSLTPGAVTPLSPPPGIPPGPTATFQGTIQTPPGWDPYAPPSPAPSPLLPNDPYLQGDPFGAVKPMTKFLQEVRLEHFWLASMGSTPFGTNDSELSATFAYPLFYNQQTPLLITPGFGIHLWDGPSVPDADLPPRAYDAFLDVGWLPQVTPWLGGELGVRVGVYSDFREFVHESLRVQARGLAVLSFSPSFQLKAGVLYLDRNRVKLLPAGGVVWTPNPDWRFDVLFPNPKIARRWRMAGTCEWWWYVRGEYGGGAWTVQRELGPRAGLVDSIDYNDLRVATGLQFLKSGGLHGFFEVGYSFDREILFYPVEGPAGPITAVRPSDTLFLGAGIAY